MEIELRQHFATWEDILDSYQYSGYKIIERVKELAPPPSIVLDVGCGFNRFKLHIPNLIGCDIVNQKADLVIDMMNLPFRENSIDCMLVLGSVNFYSYDYVKTQIEFLYTLLKPNGYMIFRGNPGEFGFSNGTKLKLFSWSEQAIIEIAEQVGFEVLCIKRDPIDREKISKGHIIHKTEGDTFRYYWEYKKL